MAVMAFVREPRCQRSLPFAGAHSPALVHASNELLQEIDHTERERSEGGNLLFPVSCFLWMGPILPYKLLAARAGWAMVRLAGKMPAPNSTRKGRRFMALFAARKTSHSRRFPKLSPKIGWFS